MSDSGSGLALKKLILLYIVEKMNIAISNSQIAQLVIEKNYMDYFSLQLYLNELVDSEYLSQQKDKNLTRYAITTEGSNALSYFTGHIPEWIKNEIHQYVIENKSEAKADFEMSANYFKTVNGDYLVKCGVYEYDGTLLMELNVTVANKDQAKGICGNWRNNINVLYGKILNELFKEK